jgi:histone H3/H4
MILSADYMKISNATVKKIVEKGSGVVISDSAASAIARILEKKAKSIAKHAVRRAKDKGRNTVQSEDIDYYRMKFGE